MLTWLESEIKENSPLLEKNVSAATYGRVTLDVARFLLAKIYLNYEKWTGTNRYADAEAICKEIMDSGNFSLAARYEDNFAIKNENGPEAIFALPHSSVYTNYAFYIYVMTFNDDLAKAFNIEGASWNGTMICQPDFFDSYDPADLRRSATWLRLPHRSFPLFLRYRQTGRRPDHQMALSDRRFAQQLQDLHGA